METKLTELDFDCKISKMDLMKVLKNEARSIHILDIMKASNFLRDDAKFMPTKERDDYITRFTRAFFTRIKDIKDDQLKYSGDVNPGKLMEFLKVQYEQSKNSHNEDELCFHHIARVVSTYTTFIREESIHPVGTRFPGGFTLRYVNGLYMCPVKDKQKDTPSALCRFCVSVQDESVES
ncbi:DUF2115 domain-containing protein [Methanobacterium petrolearium]|uniref:DUF2115 domain-containing protein n=1 Tax=Methanobacterium petrolearium TaxID=710190 RepID=UPI001AE69750|nr:DUF2115 domain-containing protein [Methanobacterium petrolearium]MBP1945166.1 uncharacterized protein (UPF0305 family) [Methanobacterium petrolearium]BDZ71092.1 hypothetical protein GCM10025861_16090 [Methanobacterium petrolearium]